MARTRKQLANLRRGGGTPETAARASEARAANRAADERLEALAAEDPWLGIEQVTASALRHISVLMRKEESAGAEPSAALTNRVRETRLLVESLHAYRAATRGPLDGAAEFFATLEGRMEAIKERMGGTFPEPHPIIEPPTRGEPPTDLGP